jgi:hypothetical protein
MITRRRKSKDRQYNSQNDKQYNSQNDKQYNSQNDKQYNSQNDKQWSTQNYTENQRLSNTNHKKKLWILLLFIAFAKLFILMLRQYIGWYLVKNLFPVKMLEKRQNNFILNSSIF